MVCRRHKVQRCNGGLGLGLAASPVGRQLHSQLLALLLVAGVHLLSLEDLPRSAPTIRGFVLGGWELVLHERANLDFGEMLSMLGPDSPLELGKLFHGRLGPRDVISPFGQSTPQNANVRQVRERDKDGKECERDKSFPKLDDVLRVDLKDEQQPQVGKDREGGGDRKDASVLDISHLLLRDATDADCGDDQKVECRASDNG
mmetsp:Transcript_92983/g.240234  ORF Transcript_92983/g.240234 Transcript_92983/m.240234 type:complete len:202 (-) Transcript_92983:451-1056(-)